MNDYFLGLDMGTGSVGWAVTDERYEIVRKHGKALWGVRLFESANTAEERRIARTARRRLARRNWRIELLQEIFSEEISGVDPGFYLRMKESRYTPDDKRDCNGECPILPYALFVDDEYTDKDYYKQFPTIYHLRKALMETTDTPDVRLVYLGLHHLMKHRGHFLFSGKLENIKEFSGIFEQLIESVKGEELDFELYIEEEQRQQIEDVLRNKDYTRSAKKSSLIKLTGARTSCEKAIFNLIVGGTVKLSDIFGDKELDNMEKSKISFADSNYDDYINTVEMCLGEQYYIIEQAKSVYDWSILADILIDYRCISEAKIAIYEKHKEDLRFLKELVKKYLDRETYQKIFVKEDNATANYSAYIGKARKNGVKCEVDRKSYKEKKDFYDFLKTTVLNAIPECEERDHLRQEIEKGTFLPKLKTKDNGVLPFQIHLYELDQILNNLEGKNSTISQYKEKIRKIFTFRIPYYVGPLNGIKKGEVATNWAIRKNSGKIYPWNFEEMIDEEASAERFIRRMTNKCTYLFCEDVLPKNSLLYSKFIVLNELNNLRINGELISVELKQKIFLELFQRYRKVTEKKLQKFLVQEGIVERKAEITGIDENFQGSLTAYHDFKEKLTGCKLCQEDKENIILNITLFGEDKKLLGKRLKAMYPQLSEAQRKSLCSLSYKGWGRLSKKFLEGVAVLTKGSDEMWSIIQTMWETNDNLMQVLSNKYRFAEKIEEENSKLETNGFSYKLVEEMNVSPSVRRQIWQTMQIVQELCKVQGGPPKRIFVEMAREKKRTGRTESRKKRLMDLYKKCKYEERELAANLEEIEEQKLRGDKLYLYYTQKGRCMYSGDVIQIDELWDNHKYDIDHIYPQSKVMDDSLDNRVLVKKTYNAEKTDIYPIKSEIRNKMQPFWKSLLDGGFISKEKYKRLTRGTEFELSELAGFIERQLVETRQGTKAVASALKALLPDTEIVYSKAKTTSAFRQDFDLIKVRELNDLHHAKDAYLNIVVGNVYYVKFTKNAACFIKENPGRTYNLSKMFKLEKCIKRDGEVAWEGGNHGTICTIKRMMKKNNILVTRRSYQEKGALFDLQLMKKGKGQVPVKASDNRFLNMEKYGGYNKASGTYFMLVESVNKKGTKIRTLEYVPLYLKDLIEKNEMEQRKYLEEMRKLKNPSVLLKRIKIDTLFKVDGFYMWLSGRQNKQLIFKGANQLLLSTEDTKTLKKVIKFVVRRKENKELRIFKEDTIEEEDLIALYDTFLNKIKNTVYFSKLAAQEKTLTEKRMVFLSLSIENKCIVLSEILHMFQCQSSSSNLKLLGGPGSAGILVMSNDITKCNQISIINQSVTGIYEQEIDLKKI